MRKGYSLAVVLLVALGGESPAFAATPLRISDLALQSYYEVSVTLGNTPNDAMRYTTEMESGGTPPPASFSDLLTATPASPWAQMASVHASKVEPFWRCIYSDPGLCVVGEPVWTPTDFHYSAAGQATVVNSGLALTAKGQGSYLEADVSPLAANHGVAVSTETWSVFHFRLVDDPTAPGGGTSLLSWSGYIDLTHGSSGGIGPKVEADVELVIVDASGRRERHVYSGAFSFSELVSAGTEVWMGVGLHVSYDAVGAGGGTVLAGSWDTGVYMNSLTIDGLDPVVISTVPEPAALLMLCVGLASLAARRNSAAWDPQRPGVRPHN